MAFGAIVQGPLTNTHATHPQVTFGAAVTPGNLVVVVHMDVAASSTPDSPLSEAITITEPVSSDDLAIYYRLVQDGDGTTYGATGAAESTIIAFEVEGPFVASPLDVTASDNGSVDPASQTTGTTATTSQANTFAVGAVADRDTDSVMSGWTNGFSEVGEAGADFHHIGVAVKVLTATGAVETSATLPTGDGFRAFGAIAVFKAGDLGGGGPALDDGDQFLMQTQGETRTQVVLW